MKILNMKSNKVKAFLKSIDLLDGQRRGEVIARRVFFLISMAVFIYLFLLVVVGRKENISSVQTDLAKAHAQEVVVETVEWVDGNKIIDRSDGTMTVIPAEVFMSAEELREQDANYQKAKKIETYLRVNRGNAPLAQYADKFVEVANKYDLDYRLLPAIAVMESSGGKSNFRPYNAWGWGKVGFNSFEQGIEVVGRGLRTGYMDKGADTIDEIAKIYCPPNATNWARSVKQFMSEIESI